MQPGQILFCQTQEIAQLVLKITGYLKKNKRVPEKSVKEPIFSTVAQLQELGLHNVQSRCLV